MAGEGRKRRTRPGLRKARASDAAGEGGGDEGDLGSLERVRELQAVRKKSKGITPVDAALGKEFRKAGADAAEQREAAAAVEEESKYGLQVFAAGDASAKKETTEEDRMKRYVEERLSGQPKAREGEGEEDDGFLAKAFNRPKKPASDEPNWSGGIAEVPVSMETKLRNIEEIEEAKRRILDRAVGHDAGAGEGAGIRRSDLPTFFGRTEQKFRRAQQRH
ncbi:hypothetical protein HKI87_05g35170 [Chloropicon roscoffensis]|uniref:Uncharacterized protein n=1 Tax=Chloropicon roscoffensis TaxID=1461544 RepID=A0AAX4P7Z7_9CHLO